MPLILPFNFNASSTFSYVTHSACKFSQDVIDSFFHDAKKPLPKETLAGQTHYLPQPRVVDDDITSQLTLIPKVSVVLNMSPITVPLKIDKILPVITQLQQYQKQSDKIKSPLSTSEQTNPTEFSGSSNFPFTRNDFQSHCFSAKSFAQVYQNEVAPPGCLYIYQSPKQSSANRASLVWTYAMSRMIISLTLNKIIIASSMTQSQSYIFGSSESEETPSISACLQYLKQGKWKTFYTFDVSDSEVFQMKKVVKLENLADVQMHASWRIIISAENNVEFSALAFANSLEVDTCCCPEMTPAIDINAKLDKFTVIYNGVLQASFNEVGVEDFKIWKTGNTFFKFYTDLNWARLT